MAVSARSGRCNCGRPSCIIRIKTWTLAWSSFPPPTVRSSKPIFTQTKWTRCGGATGLWFAGHGLLMFGDCGCYGVDTLQNLTRNFGIGDFESIRLVEGHDQLQGIHRIQTQTAGAEQRLVVPDFFRADGEHEVFDHQPSDVLFDCGYVVHYKILG